MGPQLSVGHFEVVFDARRAQELVRSPVRSLKGTLSTTAGRSVHTVGPVNIQTSASEPLNRSVKHGLTYPRIISIARIALALGYLLAALWYFDHLH
jgi:hypothetical protein